MAKRIDIVRSGGAVRFDPQTLQVDQNEQVFFCNRDKEAAHWVTKKGQKKDLWFPAALAPAPDNAPFDMSDEILIDGPVAFECGEHPGEAEGTITVKGVA